MLPARPNTWKPTVGTQLPLKTLQPHFTSEEDCDAFGDRSTQRDAPGSSHMSIHSEEMKILSVHGKVALPLATDGHDTLFTASEVGALNSLSADHSVAESLERGERLVCHEELSVQQTPDTISIKVEEDIGGGMPAVEDNNDIRDRSTQRGATSESLGVDAPGSSHMSSHNGELRILSVYGQGEGPLAVDGHDFAASELEALSSLSADHSVAKSLNCSLRLVHLEELTGHRGGHKGRPGVLGGKVFPKNANMIHTNEKPYGCDQCMKRFSRKGYLNRHMVIHYGEKPYRCDQCTKRFQWQCNLKTHMRTHSGEKPYRCDQCMKRFSQNGSLKLHMRIHSGEKPYKCDQCTMRFSLKSHLKGHMMTHSGEKPYKCDQCTKRFRKKSYLKIHMRTHSGEKPYRCDGCTKRFKQQCDLKCHICTHCSEKPYKCDQCTKRFRQKATLKLHMSTHSGEKPYKCDQCTMSFSLKGTLKTHMMTHSGEKPYKCDQCTMSFSLKGTLKIHMRTHSREKPYKCDQCVKRYSHISALKTHMRTHTGEKPYKCDQCTRRFSLKGTLKNHMRAHSGEKPYKCEQCTKCFGERSKLKRHMSTHSGEKPYRCAQCTETFSPSSKLKIHMRTYTGEKPYGCDQCMKRSVAEQEHFQWDGQEDCDAFGDRSTQRGATSEILGVDAPGSSHLASHREELKILIVHEKGEGPLAVDGHDTLFTASEVEALNSLYADHSVAESLERGEWLVCGEELSVQQQTPDTISIKVEEDIGGGMPAVEDNDIRDCATSESLGVDAPGSSHMSSHNGELRILSVYGQGEGPLAMDGHDTLFAVSEPEALSSLSADHRVAKSLNCSVRLVRLEELTGHRGGRKGRPGVLGGKVFPNNANLIVHMRTHTNEKPYGCAQCMMRFQWQSDLKIHMRTHSGEKPYKCDQCTKRFSRKGTLKIHMRTHSGEKPYECDQCTMRFRHGSALKFHMRTHTGEKPYRCDQCTMRFIRKDALKIHMKTHSGEKPCVCLQCNASYSDPSSLRLHMLKHTGNGVL